MVIVNDFNDASEPIKWVACDTETTVYVDGKLLKQSDQLAWVKAVYESHKKGATEYIRQHIRVNVYAWQISDGRSVFICSTFGEFFQFLKSHKVTQCWWFNAKFDFAQIDYAILTDPNWQPYDSEKEQELAFFSLHNTEGTRYAYHLYYMEASNNRHRKQREIEMVDLCNIIKGRLATVLKDLKVVDFDGNPIRKSSMEYESEEMSPERVNYMRIDVNGLYHAVRIMNENIETESDGVCTILHSKGMRNKITAGSIARENLFHYLYPCDEAWRTKTKFKKRHPITLAEDQEYREHQLYRGGITMLNEKYKAGKGMSGVITRKVWRYDVNSMYPAMMSNMYDLTRRLTPVPIELDTYKKNYKGNKYQAIYCLSNIRAHKIPGELPFFYVKLPQGDGDDHFVNVYESQQGEELFFFKEEYEELCNSYEFEDTLKIRVIVYERQKNPNYKKFVDHFFAIKDKAKKEHNGAMKAFAKLNLNSSYGKLSENPTKQNSRYEFDPSTGHVHLIRGETKTDETAIISVIQGALITSMARVFLMKAIRKICKNPADDFIYCDTDSIHCFCDYNEPDLIDEYEIGKLKKEHGNRIKDGKEEESPEESFSFCKYLAPKTYFEKTTGEGGLFEFHTKGVNTEIITEEIKFFKYTDEQVAKRFSAGQKFFSLSALNVEGGKALLPLRKMIAIDSSANEDIEDIDQLNEIDLK